MIILASASPRRQQLLSLICDDFKVLPADIYESITETVDLETIPEQLAFDKASYIFQNCKSDDIVIGCDTGVFVDGKMLGKPKDKQQAFEMLKMLSDRKHKVITGCAILHKNQISKFSQVTEVEFYNLTDDEIYSYINTGEPIDKAGAYGIQGKGALLVKGIVGDFHNVVGLPVAELSRRLKALI
ncbi:MAG: Maf family protein [Ruminococcus sp.]|nr:Maf family protein [Ruminococcus sp.]